MSFTGNENHKISFEEGAEQTKRYRDDAGVDIPRKASDFFRTKQDYSFRGRQGYCFLGKSHAMN